MSSAQMYYLVTGTNGLQPCKFRTISFLPPPAHNLKSDLRPFHKPQSPVYWQHQAIAVTPILEDKSLQAPQYHDLSCDRQTLKYHVQSKHMESQTDVSEHGTLICRSQQNFCLQDGVNNASGPESENDEEGRTQACDLGQGTAAVAVPASLGAEKTQSNGCQTPGAPSKRPIPLPGRQGGDEDILYYGPGLAPGSWLTGNVQVDHFPKDLSHLDMALPVPFA